MKRLLVVVFLSVSIALAATSAFAWDGCASLARQLKEKGLIDATNEAAIVKECRGQASITAEQCIGVCQSAGNAGCKAGCGIFKNILQVQ